MADPKFANLPGIVSDQPDVYETADDIPEPETSDYYEEEPESDQIERLHISTKDSYNRFKGKYLTGYVDFSDRIGKQARPGYNALYANLAKCCICNNTNIIPISFSSGVWELAGEGEKETPLQKCRRLQCEMNELLEEIAVLQGDAAISEEDRKSYEAVGEVVGSSQKMLESLRLEQALGKETVQGESEAKRLISQVAEFKKSGKMISLPDVPDSLAQSARVAELDQRLHTLEKAIGAKPEKLSRLVGVLNVNNLIEGVQQLATRAALLQPTQLDLVEARLQNLAVKMDAIGARGPADGPVDSAEAQSKEHKMKELYEIAKRTEPIAQTLPDVLSRMQTLEALHKYANNFSKLMTDLEANQASITNGIGNNKKLLQQVQAAFAENLENVNQEVAKLDARLKTLGK